MLLGKDNTNRNLSYSDQPGNQIAGIDFVYSGLNLFRNDVKVYGQFLGEDGPDPLNSTLHYIKFPSKRFSMFGLSISNNRIIMNIEHANTDSGFKNMTYNHSIYKSGYRHKGSPIGSSIDGDSHKTFLSIKINLKNFDEYLNIKFQKMHINQNNNIYSKWEDLSYRNNELNIKYSRKINSNLLLEGVLIHRDPNIIDINKNLFLFRLIHRL